MGLDVGPARPHPTGVGVYITELAAALDVLAPDRIVHLGTRAGGPVRRAMPRSGDTAMRGPHLAWIVRAADAEARAAGCRLVHYTNAVAPPRATVPLVVTIHDLSILRLPGSHPAR